MKSSSRMSLIALAASAFVVGAAAGAAAQADNGPPPWMQHWAADHKALLDAKLGGLKAGLRLTPDQEKLWGPFEAAVREAAELRMQHMASRMEMMHGGGGPGMMGKGMMGEGMMGEGMMGPGANEDEEAGPGSPIDRLEAMADRMSAGAAALKKIVDAAKPLYASLDETQKRDFNFLSREMMMLGHGHGMGMGMEMGHGHPGWGPPHHWGEDSDEED